MSAVLLSRFSNCQLSDRRGVWGSNVDETGLHIHTLNPEE
jgi:hypothetical protein